MKQSEVSRRSFAAAFALGLPKASRKGRTKDIREGDAMPDWTSLRLIWQPRMLSILRIMTGLLFLEHGTAKIFDFPHQQTHVAWALN
ncbi:MAG: hypothetical protein ACREDY_15175, partial [Bradyrhizobium sp.]